MDDKRSKIKHPPVVHSPSITRSAKSIASDGKISEAQKTHDKDASEAIRSSGAMQVNKPNAVTFHKLGVIRESENDNKKPETRDSANDTPQVDTVARNVEHGIKRANATK